jgi:hypothetical protein
MIPNVFIGIDPSFSGLGLSLINTQDKTIIFKELSVNVGHGTFAEIAEASYDMTDKVLRELLYSSLHNCSIGMEIPPVQGMYAVKLWALDTELYRKIKDNIEKDSLYLFNVPYLKFINKEYKSKKDTKEMIDKIIKAFEIEGYHIEQRLKDKRGKPRKLTSNEYDSFLYAVRMYVKAYYDEGIEDNVLGNIVEINDKFIVEKETLLGKKID